MANKWKYSSLAANERLDRIRGGDKDVYENEIARSLDVVKSRRELGLDVSEQKDWIDRVSYQYNLSGAEKLGLPLSSVNETGYADRLLSEGKSAGKSAASAGSSGVITVVPSGTEKWTQARALLDEFYGRVQALEKERANLDEWLVNNGIDRDSGEGQKYRKQFEKESKTKLESYKSDYMKKIEAIGFRF